MNKSKTVYIVPIEPLETRYTAQWYDHIPKDLKEYAKSKNIDVNVFTVAGLDDVAGNMSQTSPGAFLNFGATNAYKSSQMMKIAALFNMGLIEPNSVFLFTDAWNPTVIQLKYMSKLLQIPIRIVGIWHAGSYDPEDFLGRLVGDEPWVRHAERSMYSCYEINVFATQFHKDMFMETFNYLDCGNKSLRSGFPMNYFPDLLKKYKKPMLERKDNIVFPHRIAPEKQPEIFRDLAKTLPEFNWIVCQDTKLTKEQYHTLLGESKIVFSANLQETLGITTCIEGPLLGCVPLAPKRLSYDEIFFEYPEFLYSSEWTESWESYLKNKDKVVTHIKHVMKNYNRYATLTKEYTELFLPKYIEPNLMYDAILAPRI